MDDDTKINFVFWFVYCISGICKFYIYVVDTYKFCPPEYYMKEALHWEVASTEIQSTK
jgi:hypothetical protein